MVEKNKKAWECFILGQFYEEPLARGAVHAIANGIWSRQRRDIPVFKMEGNAYLFRVPCPNARRRIRSQSIWQFDGQTMFVAKWAPGIQQMKPELEMVPVWLELTGVPLQFFNSDALQEIVGIVGHPVCLHPSTENLTNIEVAKVYTVIDPRKELPKFVNARFEYGVTRRIGVSRPWLPSQCSLCKKLGHTITRCKSAPRTCTACNSVRHTTENCPRGLRIPSKDKIKDKGKAPIKSLLPIVTQPKRVSQPKRGFHTTPIYREVRKIAAPPLASSALQTASVEATLLASPVTPDLGTVTTVYDLNRGKLYVDFTGLADAQLASPAASGESSSDMEITSEDEDDPDDHHDQFIDVISKFSKKQAKEKEKSKARVRGPLIL